MSDTGKDKRPGFYIYRTAAVLFENLPPEVTGLVIRAASKYFRTGERPNDLSPEAQAIFEMFAQSMDEDAERYSQKCEKKRQAQAKRWEQQKQRDAQTSDAKDTSVYKCIQPYTNVYQTNSNPIATQPNSNTNQYQPNSNPSTAGAVVYNTAAAAAPDAGLTQIIQTYEDNIGVFPPAAKEPLLKWRDEFSDEIIMLAIKRAALSGVKKWNYINGILKSWKTNGVKTLADVQAQDNRKQPARGQKTVKSANEDYDEIFGELFGPAGGST